MKVYLNFKAQTATAIREPFDYPRPKSESQLLYKIKQVLIKQGHDVIKKLMWKDGHLVADTQHYLRSRKQDDKAFCIYDPNYAIRNAAHDYNHDGKIALALIRVGEP